MGGSPGEGGQCALNPLCVLWSLERLSGGVYRAGIVAILRRLIVYWWRYCIFLTFKYIHNDI